MSSGEQVFQKIIYLLQNRCCSMLCRPLQAVRVHGDLSARQRLPIFQMSNFAGRVPGLATGLMCCRRGDKLFSFFFLGRATAGHSFCRGALFRASFAKRHNPQGSHRIHALPPPSDPPFPSARRGHGMRIKSGRDPLRSPGATHVLFPETPRLRASASRSSAPHLARRGHEIL
jgi:hypothetical protein